MSADDRVRGGRGGLAPHFFRTKLDLKFYSVTTEFWGLPGWGEGGGRRAEMEQERAGYGAYNDLCFVLRLAG